MDTVNAFTFTWRSETIWTPLCYVNTNSAQLFTLFSNARMLAKFSLF